MIFRPYSSDVLDNAGTFEGDQLSDAEMSLLSKIAPEYEGNEIISDWFRFSNLEEQHIYNLVPLPEELASQLEGFDVQLGFFLTDKVERGLVFKLYDRDYLAIAIDDIESLDVYHLRRVLDLYQRINNPFHTLTLDRTFGSRQGWDFPETSNSSTRAYYQVGEIKLKGVLSDDEINQLKSSKLLEMSFGVFIERSDESIIFFQNKSPYFNLLSASGWNEQIVEQVVSEAESYENQISASDLLKLILDIEDIDGLFRLASKLPGFKLIPDQQSVEWTQENFDSFEANEFITSRELSTLYYHDNDFGIGFVFYADLEGNVYILMDGTRPNTFSTYQVKVTEKNLLLQIATRLLLLSDSGSSSEVGQLLEWLANQK